MQVLVRLSDEMYAELERLSKTLGVSKAEIMRIALKEYIATSPFRYASLTGDLRS